MGRSDIGVVGGSFLFFHPFSNRIEFADAPNSESTTALMEMGVPMRGSTAAFTFK